VTTFTPASSGAIETDEEEDDSPGFVELVAEAEDAFPIFSDVVNEFSSQLQAINDIAQSGVAEVQAADRTSRPASGRLAILKRMAERFGEPVDTMEELADEYVEQLSRVNGGIQAMAQRIPHLEDPAEVAAAVDLHGKLQNLASSATEGLDQLQSFADIVQDTARLSRSVRPVFRRMKAAVEKVASSKDTIADWEKQFSLQLSPRGDS